MTTTTELIDEAIRWVEADPDPQTQRELLDLVSRAETAEGEAELRERFSGTLQFGTAGLRAALGAGPMRMNRAVVAQAAYGVATYLKERAAKENWSSTPRAIIGFDARTKSDAFARDTAGIFTAAGLDAFLMPLPLPTPVLAWATRLLKADVGVMVTASHNPASDNGYKVYLGGQAVGEDARGAQIVPPTDSEIAAKIAQAPTVDRIERAGSGWTMLPERIARDYEHEVTSLIPGMAPASRSLSVVLTPMHGVGGEVMSFVLSRAGFNRLHVVPEQALPDPKFPTVMFPNPEEPGAMDLALQLARDRGADLVIANDPDADRVAFAVPDAETEGGWRILRGDEVGAIIGRIMLERLPASSGTRRYFANSIVSSRLLGEMAKAHGIEHRETLTGFKWIARVQGLVYGYEEALGYCVAPDLVKDKDGISAALVVADYAAKLKDAGKSLLDVLDEIAVQHGVYSTDQLSVRVEDLTRIRAMMERLRQGQPKELGGSPVVKVRDLAQGSKSLPPTEGILYLTEDGGRVIVRPSGTEPKLKCYLEAVVPVEGRESLPEARAVAKQRLSELRKDTARALGVDTES
ncbi:MULTISPECIES: phospho-sugar mutase [Micrococcaceae]|uniref:phospho-sugar mutase n=1 Tax=unclassified Kocuria TaxID=2649579 RepID=UPI0010115DE0|nr:MULTISPECIES: phospho-sugar mutase [unclassified Kocuria]